MNGEYRFLRSHGSTTRYALVRLTSEPASEWQTTIAPLPSRQAERYGDAMRGGVELAMAEFKSRGGQPQRVHIEYLEESIVDTTPDAVTCAAALAAWKAWGLAESSTQLEFSVDMWSIRFV